MCARVGNQRSHGVVTAWVRTDVVQSLRHQRRDLNQSTYPVPLRRIGTHPTIIFHANTSLFLSRKESNLVSLLDAKSWEIITALFGTLGSNGTLLVSHSSCIGVSGP
jgi:hypothetical protein